MNRTYLHNLATHYSVIGTRLKQKSTAYADVCHYLAFDYESMARHIESVLRREFDLATFIAEARNQRAGTYYGPYTEKRLQTMYVQLRTIERGLVDEQDESGNNRCTSWQEDV